MVKVTKEDLQNALDDVSYRMEEMQEKLYKNNIEFRPTIMQKIIDREAELFDHIKYCIEECEKETGREIDIYAFVDVYIGTEREETKRTMYS